MIKPAKAILKQEFAAMANEITDILISIENLESEEGGRELLRSEQIDFIAAQFDLILSKSYNAILNRLTAMSDEKQ
jgi:hypothetical protein